MSASMLDENIVSMKFDNTQFEKAAETSMVTLSKLKSSLDMTSSIKSLEQLSMASQGVDFSSLSKNIDTVKVKFSAINALMMASMTKLATKAINTTEKIVKMFTTQPMKTGFDEYELKMNSVQTIMASTGEDIKTVNGYLGELNEYADRTIYSFSDMTSNIGKFTNAGVSLKDAVAAIQGISNEAALSGANANEASRAMYNFAQALSSGSVKLIDWKSIENANMATVEFKNELINTAVEMGTLVKYGDMYKSTTVDNNGAISSAMSATKGFNDSLSHQWLTTEVLTKTLARYSDETTDIGKRAYEAATQVKTFTQMVEVLKEAAGTGWADTWEILFGNFEEARALFSALTKYFSQIIDEFNESRNAMLRGFKAKGGVTETIKTLGYLFKGLSKILKPLEQGFRDVFPKEIPPRFGMGLLNIIKALQRFVKSLQLSEDQMKSLRAIWRGVFSIVDIGIKIISNLFGLFMKNRNVVGGALSAILKIGAAVGKMFTDLNNTISEKGLFAGLATIPKNFVEAFKTVFISIKGFIIDFAQSLNIFDKIKMIPDVISNTFPKLKGIVTGLGETFDSVKEKVSGFFSNLFLSDSGETQAAAGIADASKTIEKISPTLTKFWDTFKTKASNTFDIVKAHISTFAEVIKKFFADKLSAISPVVQDVFRSISKWVVNSLIKLQDVILIISDAISSNGPNVLNTLKKIFGVVKDFFISVADKLAPVLAEIGDRLKEAWRLLKVFFASASKGTDLTEIFKVLGDIVGSFFKAVIPILKKVDFVIFFEELANVIGGVIGTIRSGLSVFKKFTDILSGILDAFSSLLERIKTSSKSVDTSVNNTGDSISKGLGNIIKSIGDFFSRLTKGLNSRQIATEIKKSIEDIFYAGVIITVLKLVKQFNKILGSFSNAFSRFLGSFTGVLDQAKETLIAYEKSLKADMLRKIAISIAILAGSIALLALIPEDKLKVGVAAVAILLGELLLMMHALKKIEVEQLDGLASVLVAVGGAVALMASGIAVLSNLDWPQLAVGLSGMAGALVGLVVATKYLNEDPDATLRGALGLLAIATIIRTMSKSIIQMSSVPWPILGIASGTLILFTLALSNMVRSIPDPAEFRRISTSFLLLGTTVAIMAASLKMLAKMELGNVIAATSGITAIFVALATAMGLLMKFQNPTQVQMVVQSFALLAGAIGVLASGLAILANMDTTEIAVATGAIVVLTGVLAAVGFALAQLPGAMVALQAFGIAVGALGAGIGIATAGIAAFLFAINALLITIPKLGDDFANGMINMWNGLTKSLPAFSSFLEKLLDTIAALIPRIALFVADLVIQFVDRLAEQAEAFGKAILKLLDVLNRMAPQIIKKGAELVDNVYAGMKKEFPGVIKKLSRLLLIGLETIAAFMTAKKKRITKAVNQILSSIFEIISDFVLVKVPKLIKKLGKKLMRNSPVFKSLVEGLGDLLLAFEDWWVDVKEYWGGIIERFVGLGKDLIDGLVEGIEAAIGAVTGAIGWVADTITSVFKDEEDIHSPSGVFEKLGNFLIDGLVGGILGKKDDAKKAGKEAAQATVDGFNEVDPNKKSKNSKSSSSSSSTKQKVSKFQELVKSIQDTIKSSTSLFEAFEVQLNNTTESILSNLETQINGVSQWINYMHLLSARGLNKTLFKELLETGPSSLGDVQTIAMMTNKEFKNLNKLYKERQALNSKTIAAQLAHDTKSRANVSNKEVETRVRKAIKNTYELKTSVDSYTKSLQNADSINFGKTIDKVSSKMTYGGSVLKTFASTYLTASSNAKVAKRSIDAATSAVENYGRALWKNSSYYKEDSKSLKDLNTNLTAMVKKRDQLKKKLQKYTEDHNSMAKSRAYAIANNLKAANQAIKATQKQIQKTTKQIAKHTKEAFDELKNSIASTVSSFLEPFKDGLQDAFDLFGSVEDTAESTASLEELQNRKLELQNKILKLNAVNTLSARLEAKQLSEELDNVNKSIESITGSSANAESKTMRDLLDGMSAQVENYKTLRTQIEGLKARGVSSGIISYLEGLGMEGASTVRMFVDATDEEIEEANKHFTEKTELSAEKMLDSFAHSLDVSKAWASGLQQLANRGLAPEILEKLGSQGPEAADTIAALLTLPDSKIAELNANYASSLSLPEELSNSIMSTYVYAGNQSVNGFLDAINGVNVEGTEAYAKLQTISASIGSTLGNMMDTNGKKSIKKLKKALKEGLMNHGGVVKKAEEASQDTAEALTRYLNKHKGNQIGDDVVRGLINGLTSKDNDVKQAAVEVARGALEAAKNTLGVQSPSKEFMAIGEYVDKGFVNGLKSGEKDTRTTMTDVMGNAIKDAYNAVGDGVNTDIIITPSLNLAKIQNGVNSMDSMLNNNYEVGASVARMNGISDSFNSIQTMHLEHMAALDRLQRTISGLNVPSDVTLNNTFHITDANPSDIAEDISRQIQFQVQRRNAAWA